MDEAQPLLGPGEADEDGDPMFPLPASLKKPRSNGKGMSLFDLFLVIFLPWLIFTLVESLFVFVYYENQWLVWLLVGVCLLLGLIFISLGAGRPRSTHLAIGLLCLAACCVGSCLGVYIYDSYASTYWRVTNGAAHTNVSPTSNGSDYADAAILTFTKDAFVDTERTLGYMEAGTVYCVAPVSAAKFTDAPQYWAAGKDCCDSRSNFQCGNVASSKAKTGVKTLDEHDQSKYKIAIRMAQSVYGISALESGNFTVTWSASPTDFTDDLWGSCMTLLILGSALYFICSVGAALMLRKSIAEGHSWAAAG